jgi:hypothetical protein
LLDRRCHGLVEGNERCRVVLRYETKCGHDHWLPDATRESGKLVRECEMRRGDTYIWPSLPCIPIHALPVCRAFSNGDKLGSMGPYVSWSGKSWLQKRVSLVTAGIPLATAIAYNVPNPMFGLFRMSCASTPLEPSKATPSNGEDCLATSVTECLSTLVPVSQVIGVLTRCHPSTSDRNPPFHLCSRPPIPLQHIRELTD